MRRGRREAGLEVLQREEQAEAQQEGPDPGLHARCMVKDKDKDYCKPQETMIRSSAEGATGQGS